MRRSLAPNSYHGGVHAHLGGLAGDDQLCHAAMLEESVLKGEKGATSTPQSKHAEIRSIAEIST
jgi:hypothetical protein